MFWCFEHESDQVISERNAETMTGIWDLRLADLVSATQRQNKKCRTAENAVKT